jgi:hypothetical protein
MKAVMPTDAPLGELASRLRADEVGDVKREYCDMFDSSQSEARRRLQEPLMPQEHEATVALADGARQCSEVINAVWNAMHP